MPRSLQRIIGKALHPGWVAVLLIAFMPLPWSVAFLSYGHPKEVWILTIGALLSLAQFLNSRRVAGDMLRPMLLCMAPAGVWLAGGMLRAGGQFAPMAAAITGFGVLLAGLALTPLAAQGIWRNRIHATALFGAVCVALLALGQMLGILEFLFPTYAHYDQKLYSVFGNQDLLGGYMALAIVLAGGMLLVHPRPSPLLWLSLPLLVFVLALSGCRTAWLAVVMGLTCLAIIHSKHLSPRLVMSLAAGMLLPVLLSLVLFWEQTGQRIARLFNGGETGGRVRLWMGDAALRMWGDHPLWGVGPGQFRWQSPAYMGDALRESSSALYGYNELWAETPHSVLLELLAEGGILGLLLGGAALCLLLRFRRSWGAMAGLVTLGVFALFNDAFHSAPHALLGLWLVACLLAEEGESSPVGTIKPVPAAGWRVLALAQVMLALLHATFILYPSALLTQAEDKHIAGSGELDLYERAARHPYVRSSAYLGMAALHVEQQTWPEALAASEAAGREVDTWTVHWLAGLSAAQVGKDALAREALELCLHRAPRNTRAFSLLWELTPVPDRAPLLEHARRWSLELPVESKTGRCVGNVRLGWCF